MAGAARLVSPISLASESVPGHLFFFCCVGIMPTHARQGLKEEDGMKRAKAIMSALRWYVEYRLYAWYWSFRCASIEDWFDEQAQANRREIQAALRGKD